MKRRIERLLIGFIRFRRNKIILFKVGYTSETPWCAFLDGVNHTTLGIKSFIESSVANLLIDGKLIYGKYISTS